MADQRQPFRFRLPWLIAPTTTPAPAPAPAPARPTQPRGPAAGATRPPFRPSGVARPPPPRASTQPPPRRTEPPPPLPEAKDPTITQTQPQPPPRPAGRPPQATPPLSSSPPRKTGPPSSPPPVATQSSRPVTKPSSPTQVDKVPPKSPRLASPTREATLPPAPIQASSPSRPTETRSTPSSPSQFISREQSKIEKDFSPPLEKPSRREPEELISKENVIKKSEIMTDSEMLDKKVAQKPESTSPSQKSPPRSPQREEEIKETPIQKLADMPTSPSQKSPPSSLRKSELKEASFQKLGSAPSSPSPKSPPSSPRKMEELKEVERAMIEDVPKTEETKKGVTNREPKADEVMGISPPIFIRKPSPREMSDGAARGPPKVEVFQRKEAATSSEMGRSPFENLTHAHPKATKTYIHRPAMPSGERAPPFHREIKEDISKFVHRMGFGSQGKMQLPLEGEDKPFSIITLAGENRGASMTLGSEAAGRRERSIRIHRGYKSTQDESVETTTDGEESSRRNSVKDLQSEEDVETRRAYINSNVQGLNNSLVFNSSVTESNPGVHYVLSRSQSRHGKEPGKFDANRAESSVTSAQRLTYNPMVKRRCLRGLLMESSDSDPENPNKPRRHGCRYGWMEKKETDSIDLL